MWNRDTAISLESSLNCSLSFNIAFAYFTVGNNIDIKDIVWPTFESPTLMIYLDCPPTMINSAKASLGHGQMSKRLLPQAFNLSDCWMRRICRVPPSQHFVKISLLHSNICLQPGISRALQFAMEQYLSNQYLQFWQKFRTLWSYKLNLVCLVKTI